MKRKSVIKTMLPILGGILTILLVMLAVLPFLNRLFDVKVTVGSNALITVAPVPDKPENVPVTVYYIMEENSKKASEIYIEVLHSATGTVSYMQIPVDTKVDLSEELYKSLQTYGPELPQHFKLANVAESFSTEYGLTAGNRVLSEVLGVSMTEYVRTTAENFQEWLELLKKEKTASDLFEAYSLWLEKTTSSRSVEERWSYYESWRQVTNAVSEIASGSREMDGFKISSKRTKERLDEMIRGTAAATETEK